MNQSSTASSTASSLPTDGDGTPGSLALQRTITKLHEGTNKFAQGVQTAFQRTGTAFISGLRTCDDMTMSDEKTEVRVDSKKKKSEIGQELFVPRHNLIDPSEPASIQTEVWGTNKFIFTLKLDGDNNNSDHKSNFGNCLIARATKKTGSTLSDYPVRCKWSRELNGLSIPIRQNNEKNFYLSPDDVGCCICVEATPLRNPADGIAFARIGPFNIDAGLRQNIEGYLACGGTKFTVNLCKSPDSSYAPQDSDQPLTLHVSDSAVKLIKPGANNIGLSEEWSAPVSTSAEIISVVLSSPSEFIFYPSKDRNSSSSTLMSSERSDGIKLSAGSRKHRDLVVVTVRCFQARQYVNTSILLEQLAVNTMTNYGKSDSDVSENSSLDYFLIIEQLTRELTQNIFLLNKNASEKLRAIAERDALEQDIDSTIRFYQKVLSDIECPQSPSDIDSKKSNVMADLLSQLEESRVQIRAYVSELEEIKKAKRSVDFQLQEQSDLIRQYLNNGATTLTSPQTLMKNEINKNNKNEINKNNKKIEITNNDERIDDTISQTRIRELEKEIQRLNLIRSKEESAASIQEEKLIASLRADIKSIREKLITTEYELKEMTKNFNFVKDQQDAFSRNPRMDSSKEYTVRSLKTMNDTLSSDTARICILQTEMTDLEKTLKRTTQLLDQTTLERNKLTKEIDQLNKQLIKTQNNVHMDTIYSNRSSTGRSSTEIPKYPPSESSFNNFIHLYEKQKIEINELKEENEKMKNKIRQLISLNPSSTHWDISSSL